MLPQAKRRRPSCGISVGVLMGCFFGLALTSAHALAKSSSQATFSEASGRSGPYAFVEWNPAALKEKTAQVNGEYMLIDGVSFGTLIKAVDSKTGGFELRSLSVGGTVTQYFFGQTLEGLFARGDFSLFLDRYRLIDQDVVAPDLTEKYSETGVNTGASLGLLVGYRAMLTDHITGSAGYGVTRNMPDFFSSSSNEQQRNYRAKKGDWRFDVQVGVGVAF